MKQTIYWTKGLPASGKGNMKCAICNNEFPVSPYPSKAARQKVCSVPCRNLYNSRISAQARGNILRGRGAGKSYRKLNARHEHRVIAEQKLGRALLSGEIVHHKDQNKLNNSESNLEIMSQAEHAAQPRRGEKTGRVE